MQRDPQKKRAYIWKETHIYEKSPIKETHKRDVYKDEKRHYHDVPQDHNGISQRGGLSSRVMCTKETYVYEGSLTKETYIWKNPAKKTLLRRTSGPQCEQPKRGAEFSGIDFFACLLDTAQHEENRQGEKRPIKETYWYEKRPIDMKRDLLTWKDTHKMNMQHRSTWRNPRK